MRLRADIPGRLCMLSAKDCLLQCKRKGRVLAVASIYRDLASLKAELEMEQALR
jgi:hypothetical protein